MEANKGKNNCEELQQEIKDLQYQLRITAQKLRESEQYKSNFLSNIRNNIINPFSSIVGLSEHIIKAKSLDLESVKNVAGLIHSESFELNFQFRNIFCAAEIEAGELHKVLEPTNITGLLSQVVDSFRAFASKKNIVLNCIYDHDPILIHSEKQYLELIIGNILHNAIKFSGNQSSIYISMYNSKEQIKIFVKDKGKGIAKDLLPNIFDRFNTIDKQPNSVGQGHGLGLPISHELIEMLDGELSIESKTGEGTMVKVILNNIKHADELQNDDLESNLLPNEGLIF